MHAAALPRCGFGAAGTAKCNALKGLCDFGLNRLFGRAARARGWEHQNQRTRFFLHKDAKTAVLFTQERRNKKRNGKYEGTNQTHHEGTIQEIQKAAHKVMYTPCSEEGEGSWYNRSPALSCLPTFHFLCHLHCLLQLVVRLLFPPIPFCRRGRCYTFSNGSTGWEQIIYGEAGCSILYWFSERERISKHLCKLLRELFWREGHV